ncbi:hypothetical protein EIC82_01220 [Enterobacter sp. A11]|uniref:hypothetical protein n=1 Tax=unclassified Enterobacter TaxID=2608935 RepID=UPI00107049F9|nr:MULTISPECIES: hypothetical protein [unclassified Enterobacter]MBM1020722.1 hypothetical protein [Enterobacter sp. E1]MEA3562026.1 hypothetical protein [Enterobacter sp. GM-22]MEA3597547.1 hypothetical protein [Enterobacter sp. GM-31]TFF59844.1 hypothetical protein EIC82_01220 [Enterobacter sp. A11]
MRYYEINIFDGDTLIRQYSSLKNGVYNPGALMVEFDIMRFGESTPAGETHLTVWGIGPKEMQQARQDLYGKRIQIFAGMSKGLPLAGVWDKKLAIDGTIFQVFGNWQGTELRLDFIIVAGPVNSTTRGQIVPLQVTMPWSMGQKLSVALTQCFMTMGGFTPNISISDRLTLNYDRPMFCGSLSELAKNLKAFSLSRIKDPGYTGVEIAVVNGTEIRVWDNDYANQPDQNSKTSASVRSKNPVQINFNDLIGQPTWISFGVVSVVCVMRADIETGDHILMPEKARPMIQASSYSQFRDDSAFNGEFVVQSVRLLGNSRQPTAEAWITVIEAYPAEAVKTK